ncbi:MAG: Tex family protein [Burkholderiaceae bacterium]
MNPPSFQALIIAQLATELAVERRQIVATIELLDQGATVPFIARYRKEATGGLDDTQLRLLVERLDYLRELETRRAVVLESIRSQDKLSAELEQSIVSADSKQRLEDLYLPYKPKRRTRAQTAREAGLEPLAADVLHNTACLPDQAAAAFLNPAAGFADVKAVLDGVRDILAERFAEDADLLGRLRLDLWQHGMLMADVIDGKQAAGEKFRDYFEHAEAIKAIPSHRALAMLRGREQGILSLRIDLADRRTADSRAAHPYEQVIAAHIGLRGGDSARDQFLSGVCRWTWRVKLAPALETDLTLQMKTAAELKAIHVFADNLKDLLLAAPAGFVTTLGLDPGIRTGVKVAVIDGTGKVLDTTTIYPHEPRRDWEGALQTLTGLCRRHAVGLIAIGNGTASRETDQLAKELMARNAELNLKKLVVSEAGASVYSASELAAREFPTMDVSLRGAVSIARRLQDPLAELVKIDPKAIGVGQYQHDIDQRALSASLDSVVEDCVNAVGVEVNTASEALLARVAGLNGTIARSIVEYRDQHGAYASRKDLLKVPRLGAKTFEQAAGFLRIRDGRDPLDQSAVHPEAYPLVEKILASLQKPLPAVLGHPELLRGVRAAEFVDDRFGLPTVQDILKELEKPGRDPRPAFTTATFDDRVQTMADLQPGQRLEGVVTNVANFGAFVDIGVHQDGLVHISALSDQFVKDPRDVVKAGQVVNVRVVEVDIARKRIALTMKTGDTNAGSTKSPAAEHHLATRSAGKRRAAAKAEQTRESSTTALAAAFANARK